jgi:hypothetical protein
MPLIRAARVFFVRDMTDRAVVETIALDDVAPGTALGDSLRHERVVCEVNSRRASIAGRRSFVGNEVFSPSLARMQPRKTGGFETKAIAEFQAALAGGNANTE